MAKTWFGKLFEKIGSIFEGLFNGAEKAYNEIQPEVQDALKQGSEIVALLNRYVDATPAFIISAILEKWPNITKERLQEVLLMLSERIGVIENYANEDLEDNIKILQQYLQNIKFKDGSQWAWVSSAAAELLALLLAPKGTKFATIGSLIEYVYRTFVKKG